MNAWTLALANLELPNKSGAQKCSLPSCSNWFDTPPNVSNKRFCSESCRQQQKTIRRRAARVT